MKRFKAIIILFVIAISSVVAGTLLACSASEGEVPLEQLAAPANLVAIDNVLHWDEVEGASGYMVELNGVSNQTEDNYFAFNYENATKVQASVKAFGNEVYNTDSEWSSLSFTYERPTAALKYTLLEDGTGYEVARSGSLNEGLSGRVVMRDYYNGLPVKKIADYAFAVKSLFKNYDTGANCNTVTTSVRLPAFVEEIGDYAFDGCIAYEGEMVLPQSVKKIGIDVFLKCYGLNKINIPEGITEIPTAFLMGTKIDKISIPESVTKIERSAFGWTLLNEIEIPNSVTYIGEYAFKETLITEVVIPESVTYIGHFAFNGCNKLDKITLPKNLEYLGIQAFDNTAYFNKQEGYVILRGDILCGYNGVMPSVIEEDDIPAQVKYIAGAFYNRKELKFIKLRDDIAFLGTSFNFCSNLEEVKLPAYLTEIHGAFFNGCQSLKSVIIPNAVSKIGLNAFGNCKALSTIFFEGTEEQWNKIEIETDEVLYPGEKGNTTNLNRATKYFYVENEEDVPAEGNYWHYAPDGVTPLIWS